MARDFETMGRAGNSASMTTDGFDRRVLLRPGQAQGAGLAATGALARIGLAQDEATTDAASTAAGDAIL
jgi:hypothetical protein